MKKMYLLTIAMMSFLFCSSFLKAQEQQSANVVKVIYFHGNNRCTTCNNMEKYTRELLGEDYSAEMKKGKVVFEVYNFDDESNAEIVAKYKIESSTLLLVKTKNGKEKLSDLTEIGFNYAKYEEEKFKESVAKKLNEALR